MVPVSELLVLLRAASFLLFSAAFASAALLSAALASAALASAALASAALLSAALLSAALASAALLSAALISSVLLCIEERVAAADCGVSLLVSPVPWAAEVLVVGLLLTVAGVLLSVAVLAAVLLSVSVPEASACPLFV